MRVMHDASLGCDGEAAEEFSTNSFVSLRKIARAGLTSG